jgi:hypothetical protein
MAGSFGDYEEAKVLDAIFGQTALPAVATTYIALFTITPTDADASGTEVTGGSYARQAFTNNTTNWPAASGTTPVSKANGVAITWATAPTANWGTVVAFAVYDAATVGNQLAWGPLSVSKTINNGDAAPSFAIGALTITLD